MTFSRLMSGVSGRALMGAEGVGGGGAAPGGATEPPIAPTAEPAPAAPAAAETAAPAGDSPKVEAPAPAAPSKEFAPSLLDEAPTPAADPAKPAEPAPPEPSPKDKEAAKPDGEKPPAPKEPAAEAAKPDPAKPAEQVKPDPAKPAEQAKPEPPAPIEYAFTYPEGVKPQDVNQERMGAFTGVLNDLRAAPEVGQKLLNLHLEEATRIAQETEQRVSERQWSVFQDQQKAAREEVMADPVLGGSRHDTAKRTIMSGIDAYLLRDENGKPRSADVIAAEKKQLMDDFRATGIANRRSLLSLLHWVGEKTREGTPRPAPPPRGGNPNPQNRGLRRYQGTTPASNGAA